MYMYFTYTLFTDILFIKWNNKTLQIILKTSNNDHKTCEETIRNMSCVFPFCKIENYHGNLGFLFWNISEKSVKFWRLVCGNPVNLRISQRILPLLLDCVISGLCLPLLHHKNCVYIVDRRLFASKLACFLPEASFGLRVLSLPASVCPSVHHQVCLCDNSSPIQARITKFGP